MGNSICACARKSKKKKGNRKYHVDADQEYSKHYPSLSDSILQENFDPNKLDKVTTPKCQDFGSEYIQRSSASDSLRRVPLDPIDLLGSKHNPNKQNLSYGPFKRVDADEQSIRSPKRQQKGSSLKRESSINSGRRTPDASEHGSRHGSLKRQLSHSIKRRLLESKVESGGGYETYKKQKYHSDKIRSPEPPRLVMWGLYEPKCPSNNWASRVQQDRVTAMEHGHAIWHGDSSLPAYLRRYFRENTRRSDPSTILPEVDLNQPDETENLKNHCTSESAIIPTTIQSAHTTTNVSCENQCMFSPLTRYHATGDASFRRTVSSESDSAFQSLSYGFTDCPAVALEGRFQSRYTVKDPRSPSKKKARLIPFNMTDNWTQYDGSLHPAEENRVRNLMPTGSCSYDALQESLNLLQTAVEELAVLSTAASISKQISVDNIGSICSLESRTFEENPIFVPKLLRKGVGPTGKRESPVKITVSAIDVNSNIDNFPTQRENIQRVKSDNEMFVPSDKFGGPIILPATATPLNRSVQINESIETITRSEDFSFRSLEGASSIPTLSSGRKSRLGGTYEKNGVIHYRIRVVASPKNIDLFRHSSFASDSQTKNLVDIAKECHCQLHLLPKKDYVAGVAKRTLLIRSAKRRYIKSCLREISEHFPSLVTIR